MHEPFDRTEDPDNLAINPDPCYQTHMQRENATFFLYWIQYIGILFCE